MKQKITILSTTNLSANPRALKEIKTAAKVSKAVVFIGFDIQGWTVENEKQIQQDLPENVQLHYISATRKPFLPWLCATLIEKLCGVFGFLVSKNLKITAFALNKRAFLLFRFLKQNKFILKDTDILVAHTLGTLYPVYKISKRYKIPFAFDVEDYHPGEFVERSAEKVKKQRVFLMKNLLPFAKYISYASPLIGEYTLNLLEKKIPHQLINNSFLLSEIEKKCAELNLDENKLNLVWYSQHISFGRGLEYILPVLKEFQDIKLYLIGKMDENFLEKFNIKSDSQIEHLGIFTQADLNASLKYFDVGLALDFAEKDLNRELALTNKIISYYQAGLYIFAFKTQAQERFIRETKSGICIEYSKKGDIESSLSEIINNKGKIRSSKAERFEKAKKMAWEKEGNELLKLWED